MYGVHVHAHVYECISSHTCECMCVFTGIRIHTAIGVPTSVSTCICIGIFKRACICIGNVYVCVYVCV